MPRLLLSHARVVTQKEIGGEVLKELHLHPIFEYEK
jgi:hypothetical protein